jgi:hypothetical protein
MTGLSGLHRIARAGLTATARRWPEDLSETMAYEWGAELDAIRHDPRAGRTLRAYRMIAFAGSIALAPPVEEAGAEPATWRDRLARPASATGLVLLAAAMFNVAHLLSLAVLAVAAVLMAVLGSRFRGSAGWMTALMGVSMFAFLMAGNEVAVMPFMGWADIVPAVAVWTLLTAGAAALAARGRRLLGVVTGLAALEAAAIAGSLHAAHLLGLGLGSAPSWLPLALLPGGTAHFGAYHADGAVAFGGLRGSGPAYYTSEILLGNASAMIGPMLLCSAFVLALALRRSPRPAVAGRRVLRVPLGVAGTVGALIACELIRRSTDVDGTLHRILDNSTVFGFGFLADTPGRIAVALLGGFLIARIGDDARPHGIA